MRGPSLALLALIPAALVLSGCGGKRYAGISQAKAVQKARGEWVTIAAVLRILGPKSSAKALHEVNTTEPLVTEAHCGKQEVWRVTWPPLFPLFVNAATKHLVVEFGQSATNCGEGRPTG